MSSKKIPIPLIIKEIIDEKNYSVSYIAEKLGKGVHFVYDTFKRKSMKVDELDIWAAVLGVSVEEIIERQFPKNPEFESMNLEIDSKISDDYLKLLVKELKERIKEQNLTIATQSETIRVLLGKSEAVPFLTKFVPNPSFFR